MIEVVATVCDADLDPLVSTLNYLKFVMLETYAKELAKKNKEMAIALANRSQVTSVSAGSSTGETSGKSQQYFSNEQISSMKNRWKLAGISEDKWEGMLKSAEAKMKEA